ncbi:cytochrome b/b6 domain-containing protein [Pandoraea nosoerga]|uniref:Cytochrome B n=1 Tax=Pandoraea nosoerga TaxID=2508296 RepID=A0A5E4XHB9_9BURK|nr:MULTISPECIES: cytochrome b/b6 domain-containing protein [Pandoraea]MBN4668093.1 cytochrome b/b6 domain-containing protein [Pandoraea nosoerga]MBN4677916.1 cytochrome b/b6 domain-containing protein [Pandoraea nosoerga]MBN4683120.1 cytochrome b/b6 domain-containing protein [Pandoraea nosoerga]MBN4746609.1 cytochrome b/b6 domain-containing protein [Pandoraea nosoerga]VVE35801.1 cytochrome B [Pandoraea nosoerga]
MKPIRIWDLPTRLFHWSFVVIAVAAYVTAKTGGNAMVYHFWCGYAILALLIFRVVWGLAGPRYARFSAFLTGPLTFVRSLRDAAATDARFAGHTPLGGLSVIAMLLFFGIQAVLGLFSNDDIFNDGPLVKFIDKDLSDALTGWHQRNQWVLVALVALHVLAIVYYRVARKKDLITPMIGGDKHLATPAHPARDDWRVRAGALVLIALASALVYRIVHLTPAVASLPSY